MSHCPSIVCGYYATLSRDFYCIIHYDSLSVTPSPDFTKLTCPKLSYIRPTELCWGTSPRTLTYNCISEFNRTVPCPGLSQTTRTVHKYMWKTALFSQLCTRIPQKSVHCSKCYTTNKTVLGFFYGTSRIASTLLDP